MALFATKYAPNFIHVIQKNYQVLTLKQQQKKKTGRGLSILFHISDIEVMAVNEWA